MLNGVHLAMITTKRILAERLLPAAIESAMTVREFGSRIGVDRNTSARFLNDKLRLVQREVREEITGFTDRACHTLERTATRQIERLVALAEKPLQGWSRADLALERQAVTILGQILNLENKMKTQPTEKPPLSLGNL
jgi:hypothetical protein